MKYLMFYLDKKIELGVVVIQWLVDCFSLLFIHLWVFWLKQKRRMAINFSGLEGTYRDR